ncbi:MAG: 4-amino-4-deoxy-L-arabinose transferase and related glycosyltransferase of family, partial [Capsulimonas sp.]|nr:4-amino-4-deoxy-L-arabinose transferase and related glycosyltransferase of family [Capsulimonas sp.]
MPLDWSTRRLDKAACVLLFVLTAFRLWYAASHQLLQDEAYYWQWSRHLDWGYYDNTPLMAVVIRVFTSLLGPTELGVRAGAIFCALIASAFIYLIMRRLTDARVAFVALVMASVIPLFAAGADIMTQDPVQLALWAAALYVILHALDGKGWLWIVGGVLAGLAAMAKLNALLLLPSILLYLALSKTHRYWLRRPEPYVAAAIALAIFSPFVWWNHTHQNAFWMHIHAMGTRNSEHDPPFKWFLRFAGDQALLMSPLLMLTFLRSLGQDVRDALEENNDAFLFLWAPSVVVFGATALLSLKSKVEGNWPAAAYVTGACLLALALTKMWDRGVTGRRWAIASVSLATVLSIG